MHTPMSAASLRPPRPQNFRQQLGTQNQQQPKPPSVSQMNLQTTTVKKGQLPSVGVSTA